MASLTFSPSSSLSLVLTSTHGRVATMVFNFSVSLSSLIISSFSLDDSIHPVETFAAPTPLFLHSCFSFLLGEAGLRLMVPPLCPLTLDFVSRVPGLCYLVFWPLENRAHTLSVLGFFPTYAEVTCELHRSGVAITRDFCISFPSDGTFPLVIHASRVSSDHSVSLLQSGSYLDLMLARLPVLVGSSQVKPAATFSAQPILALGGVRQVPTSLVVPHIATSALNRTWTPDVWSSHIFGDLVDWQFLADGRVINKRASTFTYHYPETLSNPRLPRVFTEDLQSCWLRSLAINDQNTVATNYSRRFRPTPPTRSCRDIFSAVGQVMQGRTDYDVLKAADAESSVSRAMGSRGARTVPRWESEVMPRWLRFKEFATRSAPERTYHEFAFRLVSRYLFSEVAAEVTGCVPDYTPFVANTATNVVINFINADPIIPPPPPPAAPGQPMPMPAMPQWGEHTLWDERMLVALLDGTAQFIDAEGFSREEIAQILGCLVPTSTEHIPHLRKPAVVAVDSTPAQPEQTLLCNVARHRFPNGVTHVFVHYGAQALPSLADQQWIRAHANPVPQHILLGSVMRAYALRHGLEEAFLQAFDAVGYRTVGFSFDDVLGTASSKRSNTIIDSNGSDGLHLPRNNTAHAYFDAFYAPAPLTNRLEAFLSLTPRSLIHATTLMCHFRAVSMSWAGKAATATGAMWTRGAPATNQFLRNHHDKFARLYYDEINIWSTLFANTQATQYGFSTSPYTRRTEDCSIIDWWITYMPPTMRNHYLELWAMQHIPTFQVLPYHDAETSLSHVEWAPGTPEQTDSLISFSADKSIRLAREFDAFPGHAWLGDGGAEYNAQFYNAQGDNGRFCYEGSLPKMEVKWWEGTYARSFPAAPQTGAHLTLAPTGTHFSDFILPGSLMSYRVASNKVVNWGVAESHGQPLTSSETLRWWQASRGQSHTSLMVNYVSPLAEHYELDAMADYTVVVWESHNGFAAMTFGDPASALTTSTFEEANTRYQQLPFELHFDSAPRSIEQHVPTRVSNSQQRVSMRDYAATPAALASARRARVAERANLSYTTKYPLYADEVPPMQAQEIEVGLSGLNAALPVWEQPIEPEMLDRLAKIDAAKRHLEELTQEQAREDLMVRANMRISNSEAARSNPRITVVRPQVAQRNRRSYGETPSANVRAHTGPRLPVITEVPAAVPKTNQYAQVNRPFPRRPISVVPNDAAAAASQQFAATQAEILRARSNLSPVQIVAGSRRATSPRTQYRQNSAYSIPDGRVQPSSEKAFTPLPKGSTVQHIPRPTPQQHMVDSTPQPEVVSEESSLEALGITVEDCNDPAAAERLAAFEHPQPFLPPKPPSRYNHNPTGLQFGDLRWASDPQNSMATALERMATRVTEVQESDTTAKN